MLAVSLSGFDPEQPFVEALSCKHQSHNFLASRERSQPQSATPTFEPREAVASAAQAGSLWGWRRASGEFRIADGAPNAYSDTEKCWLARGHVSWAKWRWALADVTTHNRLRSAGHTSFGTAGVT
jgi:hypothetical protein